MKTLRFFEVCSDGRGRRKKRGRGRGRCQLNEELIDIQNLNYQNYLILPAEKLTNSERQVRDGGRHSEERCIVLIDTDQNINCRFYKNGNQTENKPHFLSHLFSSFIVIVIIIFYVILIIVIITLFIIIVMISIFVVIFIIL